MTSLAITTFTACGGETSNAESTTEGGNVKVTLPPFTIVKSDVDGKDANYRVQVGDTLPNEQESIAIFREVTGIKDGPASRNTAVYFTRAGFSAIADAHAHVSFLKSDEAPKYVLQTAGNERLKEAADFTFDSIPDKKLVVELLDAQGSKVIIYQKPSGAYFKVIIFSKGDYDDLEPMKAGPGNSAGKIVLTKIESGENFTYKEDETGKMIEVYNGNNSLFNSYKILKKG